MYTEGWEDDCEGLEVNHSRHIKTTPKADTQKMKLPDVSKKYSPFACAFLTLETSCMLTLVVLTFINLVASEGTYIFTYQLIQHHLYGPGVLPVEHRASSLSPAAASEKPFMKVEKSNLESIF